jgi:hypothetical protein
MTTPSPATTAKELTERLNALIRTHDFWNISDTFVAELLHEAEKLQRADARESFVLRGSVYAMCGDVEQTLHWYDKALKHPDVLATRCAMWISFGNLGLFKLAHEHGSWLLDAKRAMFANAWSRALTMGHVLETRDRLADNLRTFPELARVDFSLVHEAAEVMQIHGLTDAQLVSVLDLAGEIFREERTGFASALHDWLKIIRPPEDPPYLHFGVPVNVSPTKVAEMNKTLSRRVVERLPNGVFPPGVVVSFTKPKQAKALLAA